MSDLSILAETPEEKAGFESVRTETPIVEAPPEKPAELAKPEEQKPAAEKPKAEERVRLVPHAALHEERERRKNLEKRLQELEQAKPKAETPAELDEHTDPIGVIGQLKAKIAEQERQQREWEESQRTEQDIARRAGERINAYAAEHPEYKEQLQFLRQSRFEELRFLGQSPENAARQIEQEEKALARMALDDDMDPGEIVANLSRHRGWKPAAPDPNPDPKPGPAARPAPQAAAIKEEIAKSEAKIERLEKGQRAARSPSTGGGGAAENELSLEAIANLDGAAFDKAFKNVKDLMA